MIIDQVPGIQGALDSKVAVVTGAGRGIGREAARTLARLGATVVFAEVQLTGAEVSNEVRAEGGKALFVQTDVSDEASVARLFDWVITTHGQADILVNNATVFTTGPLWQHSLADWDRVMAVNLRGAFLCIRTFLPHLLERRTGVVMTMESSEGMPYLAPYLATKVGLRSLALSLSQEVGEQSGVSVFCFGPGMVDTPGLDESLERLPGLYGMSREEFIAQSGVALLSPEAEPPATETATTTAPTLAAPAALQEALAPYIAQLGRLAQFIRKQETAARGFFRNPAELNRALQALRERHLVGTSLAAALAAPSSTRWSSSSWCWRIGFLASSEVGNAMKGVIITLGVVATLTALVWGGLQVRPRPFRPYPDPTPELRRIPIPQGLPAPVARFYQTIAGDSIPVIETAVLSGRGDLRFKGIKFPTRFRFTHQAGQSYRHYMEASFFGQALLKVNEHYLKGVSRFELPFGVVENEPKQDSAANLGLWAESVALPSLFLTDPRVRWEPIDETHARLVVPAADDDVFTVTFDPETGLIRHMEAMRWKEITDTEKTLWLCEVRSWERHGGVLLPTVMSAKWENDKEHWLVMTLEEVVYNVDVTSYIQAKGP